MAMVYTSGEKESILPSNSTNQLLPSDTKKAKVNCKKLCLGLGVYCALRVLYANRDWFNATDYSAPACPQVNAVTPQKNADLWNTLNDRISTPEFKESAINWLGGAVRVP